MNFSGQLHDAWMSRMVDVLRFDADARARVLDQLQVLRKDLVSELAQADPTGVTRTAYQQARLKTLLASVDDVIGGNYQSIEKLMASDAQGLLDIQATHAVTTVNQVLGVDLLRVRFTVEQLAAIQSNILVQGAPSSEWWSRQAEDMRQAFSDEMRQGMLRGETLGQLIKRVDGIVDTARHNAEALVRSSVMATANSAHLAAFQVNDRVVKGIQWLSTLDSRTTITCFPGSVSVVPVGPVVGLSTRWFEGDVVVVATATGKEIIGTPNHPVLTAAGWLPLQELEPGHHVVYTAASDGFCVHCRQDVGVPTTFAQLADAIGDPSVSDISCVSSSTAQFHGDGMGVDHKVYISCPKRNLSTMRETRLQQHPGERKFGGSHGAPSFSCESLPGLHPKIGMPIGETPQVCTVPLEDAVEPAFGPGPAEVFEDHSGAHPILKQLHGRGLVLADGSVTLAAMECWHDAEILEQARHGGSRGFELPCQGCGGFSVPVAADDVVSVRRQDFAGHVYNLQTHPGVYIAGGIIVHNCQVLDGMQWDLDYQPIDHALPFPGPTAHWGCFVEGTEVYARDVWAKTKRLYSGNVVVVRTAGGKEITVTPNHPILTDQGWVNAGGLKKGNKVVCSGIRKGMTPGVHPDHKEVESRIEDVAVPTLGSGEVVTVQVPTAPHHFHGDGAGSEVAVVWTNCALGDARESTVNHHGHQCSFGSGCSDTQGGFSCHGEFDSFLDGSPSSTGRSMACGGEGADLLGCGTGHPGVHGIAAPPDGNTGILNPPLDDVARDIESFCNRLHALASFVSEDDLLRGEIDPLVGGADCNPCPDEVSAKCLGLLSSLLSEFGHGLTSLVSLDEVIEVIDRTGFVGHVYNLETEGHWYVANGIVAHNCRSTQIPVLKSYEELLTETGGDTRLGKLMDEMDDKTRSSLDGYVSAGLKYEDWLRTKPVAFQKEVLGPRRWELWTKGKLSLREMLDQSGNPLTLAQLRGR